MSDLPIDLDAGLSAQLARVLDVEGKIARTLEALGPVGGRDVVVVDGSGELHARRLAGLGAQAVSVDSTGPAAFDAPDGSADVMIAFWSAFRGPDAVSMAQAGRILRPGGRLLVVHDYGRDDVSRLRGVLPEHGSWSRRDGPFLSAGFKVRVVHCWWTFDSLDAACDFLTAAFPITGNAVAAGLTRPRVSYNVAVYHRTFGKESG